MTARAESVVLVDAAQVYAEGVAAGVKQALAMVLRHRDGAQRNAALRKLLHEWECHVVHLEWMAREGCPVTFERDKAALALIDTTLRASGLSVVGDGDGH